MDSNCILIVRKIDQSWNHDHHHPLFLQFRQGPKLLSTRDEIISLELIFDVMVLRLTFSKLSLLPGRWSLLGIENCLSKLMHANLVSLMLWKELFLTAWHIRELQETKYQRKSLHILHQQWSLVLDKPEFHIVLEWFDLFKLSD